MDAWTTSNKWTEQQVTGQTGYTGHRTNRSHRLSGSQVTVLVPDINRIAEKIQRKSVEHFLSKFGKELFTVRFLFHG